MFDKEEECLIFFKFQLNSEEFSDLVQRIGGDSIELSFVQSRSIASSNCMNHYFLGWRNLTLKVCVDQLLGLSHFNLKL